MADYPVSVKSFTSKSAGQTIDASHVNDLQDEVNAIEAGLLNGTARLNSSNSTVQSLAVSSHVGSSGSRVPVIWVSQLEASSGAGSEAVAARVRQSSGSSLATGAQAIVFEFNEDVDLSTSVWHDTGTNPSRLAVPSTGWFAVTGAAAFRTGAGAAGAITLQLLVDSTRVVGSVGHAGGSTTPIGLVASAMLRVDADTSFFELRVLSTLNTTSAWVVSDTGTIVLSAARV